MRLSEFAGRKGASVLWFCSRLFFFLVLDEKTEWWTKRVLSLSVVPLLPVYLSAVGGSTPCRFSINSYVSWWWVMMLQVSSKAFVLYWFPLFFPLLIFWFEDFPKFPKIPLLFFHSFSPVNCSVVATQVCFCLRRLVECECEWVVGKN